jgi:phosphoketolase
MLHVWRQDDNEFSHQYLRSINPLQRNGTTTMPFAMVALNGLDRYRLAMGRYRTRAGARRPPPCENISFAIS